jgi:hypothetical protein
MNFFIFKFVGRMQINKTIFRTTAIRKVAILILIAASAMTAFATLGDGKSKGKKASLLNNKSVITPGKFTLKSGYQYRGSQIINQQRANNTVTLNSLVTYQKGHITYILPIKTVIPQKVKVSLGIPQLNKK